MIEKIVLDYLNSALSVPCFMEKPENAPERFVLLDKVGSGGENHIYSATIAVQSYAGSLFEAAELNLEVKSAMEEIIILDEVTSCKLNSDYNFTDPKKKQYRYQAVFNIIHYKE